MEIIVHEGLKIFGAMKMMFNIRSAGSGVKRNLYERVVVPTLMYAAETYGLRLNERHKLDVKKN